MAEQPTANQRNIMYRTDRVKDEIARQAAGLSATQYAEFLRELSRQVNIMASYAAGDEGRPSLKAVNLQQMLTSVLGVEPRPGDPR